MKTTYTQEQCKRLAREYVLAMKKLGISPTPKAGIAWLRSAYPFYFNQADKRAFLKVIEQEGDVKHGEISLRTPQATITKQDAK